MATKVHTLVRSRPAASETITHPKRRGIAFLAQIMRFGIVGILNTFIDVLALNILLWRFPTHNANLLLVYNSIAYALGAMNSFGLNKYWTFRRRSVITGSELVRFAIVNVVGFLCNDGIIWVTARLLHPFIASNLLWANASKASAVIGTMAISYLGMRLWVFAVEPRGHVQKRKHSSLITTDLQGNYETMSKMQSETNETGVKTKHSLSVILPAHNEEEAITGTVQGVVDTLAPWVQDFEVIVVNDGSKDDTRTIVETLAATDVRIRLINHPVNQGYGAALVSGFESVTKDLAFFMDSDGQFDIHDIERFFPLIEEFDAVLGYRIDRQDTWMRKVNAWGWKMLVRLVFGLRVRDVDCAFKLYRARFFTEHHLETRGAMINTEIIYKFKRAGYTYTQVGVHHLPRKGGRATGAKLSVIARAFRELFVYALKWRREEKAAKSNTPARL